MTISLAGSINQTMSELKLPRLRRTAGFAAAQGSFYNRNMMKRDAEKHFNKVARNDGSL